MKINKTAGERGFLKLILIIIILILIVSYFGINLRELVSAPTTQDNVSYVWTGVVNVWNHYLKAPVTAIWNFFISYIWNIAIESIKNGSIHMPSLTGSTTPLLGGQ